MTSYASGEKLTACAHIRNRVHLPTFAALCTTNIRPVNKIQNKYQTCNCTLDYLLCHIKHRHNQIFNPPLTLKDNNQQLKEDVGREGQGRGHRRPIPHSYCNYIRTSWVSNYLNIKYQASILFCFVRAGREGCVMFRADREG